MLAIAIIWYEIVCLGNCVILGNRACIGDNVGRWIVQLFFANTMNQMKMSLPKGYYYNLEEAPDCGMTLVPKPYELVLESRR